MIILIVQYIMQVTNIVGRRLIRVARAYEAFPQYSRRSQERRSDEMLPVPVLGVSLAIISRSIVNIPYADIEYLAREYFSWKKHLSA